MEAERRRLFREWVESWRSASGLGVPCAQAQADGVPCFELGRECAECEEAFQTWLAREGKGPGEDLSAPSPPAAP